MALPVWPSTLPELRGDASSGGVDEMFRPPQVTQFDDGPARMRRRSFYEETTVSVTLHLDGFAQLDTFKAFVSDTLNHGARRFTGPVWKADGATATKTCRINGSPSVRFRAPQLPSVSFTLVIESW